MRRLAALLSVFAAAIALSTVAGCVSLRPVAPVVDAPGGVRVLVRAVDGDRFRLEIVNFGHAPIVVDRDRVVLQTARGARARVAGGARGLDDIVPGDRHALDVRFTLGGVHTGDRVAVSLAGAVSLNGRPVIVPPLEFVAD